MLQRAQHDSIWNKKTICIAEKSTIDIHPRAKKRTPSMRVEVGEPRTFTGRVWAQTLEIFRWVGGWTNSKVP